MHLQPLLPIEGSIAAFDRTDEVFQRLVRVSVVAQVTLGHERFIAPGEVAFERSIVLQLRAEKAD